MTKLPAFLFIAAIAGLVTVPPAMSAGLGRGDRPDPAANLCSSDGNNCTGQVFENVEALPYSGSRMYSAHNSPANRRADEAWAKGDLKEACKWAEDAQGQTGGDYAYYAVKVGKYCSVESGSSARNR